MCKDEHPPSHGWGNSGTEQLNKLPTNIAQTELGFKSSLSGHQNPVQNHSSSADFSVLIISSHFIHHSACTSPHRKMILRIVLCIKIKAFVINRAHDPWTPRSVFTPLCAGLNPTHASKSERTEKPGVLQFMGSQRVRHNSVNEKQHQMGPNLSALELDLKRPFLKLALIIPWNQFRYHLQKQNLNRYVYFEGHDLNKKDLHTLFVYKMDFSLLVIWPQVVFYDFPQRIRFCKFCFAWW